MSEEKVLTKEIADEIIIKEKDSVFLYLDEFTQIDDQAAEVLPSVRGIFSLGALPNSPVPPAVVPPSIRGIFT